MLTKIKNFFTKEIKNDSDNGSDLKAMNEDKIIDKVLSVNDNQNNGKNISTEDKIIDKGNQVSENEAQKTDPLNETDAPVVSDSAKSKHSPEEIKDEVIKVLKTCYDPEIPVDVWELGLIYEINVATNGDVLIVMTLTSPSCPVAGILPNEIEQKVKEHPMVNDCKVQLTFDPPWSQFNMSEVAKLELGFL
jgi:FeS assembly SUF system protein